MDARAQKKEREIWLCILSYNSQSMPGLSQGDAQGGRATRVHPLKPSCSSIASQGKTEKKSILTEKEVKALFGTGFLETMWDGALFHYALNLPAATTGMRLGVIRGLVNRIFLNLISMFNGAGGNTVFSGRRGTPCVKYAFPKQRLRLFMCL